MWWWGPGPWWPGLAVIGVFMLVCGVFMVRMTGRMSGTGGMGGMCGWWRGREDGDGRDEAEHRSSDRQEVEHEAHG